MATNGNKCHEFAQGAQTENEKEFAQEAQTEEENEFAQGAQTENEKEFAQGAATTNENEELAQEAQPTIANNGKPVESNGSHSLGFMMPVWMRDWTRALTRAWARF